MSKRVTKGDLLLKLRVLEQENKRLEEIVRLSTLIPPAVRDAAEEYRGYYGSKCYYGVEWTLYSENTNKVITKHYSLIGHFPDPPNTPESR